MDDGLCLVLQCMTKEPNLLPTDQKEAIDPTRTKFYTYLALVKTFQDFPEEIKVHLCLFVGEKEPVCLGVMLG